LKLFKYLLAVLIALAIVAAALHYKRETIARNIANSALSGLGLVATDLSIDTIATDHIVFSRLVLEQEGGTRYELRGLRFPIDIPDLKDKIPTSTTISIDEIWLFPGAGRNEEMGIADMLQSLFQWPENLPSTVVTVGKAHVPDFPVFRNLHWQVHEDYQRVFLGVDVAEVHGEVRRDSPDMFSVRLDVATTDGQAMVKLPLQLARTASGFSIDGNASIRMHPALQLLQSLELVPAGLTMDTTLEGPVSIEVNNEGTKPVLASAEFSINGDKSIGYKDGDESTIDLHIAQSGPLLLRFSYPSPEWTVGISRGEVAFSSYSAGDIPVTFENLECRSGIQCVTRLSGDNVPFNVEHAGTGSATFATSVALSFDGAVIIEISSDTTLIIRDL
jgi:hypothetical protein